MIAHTPLPQSTTPQAARPRFGGILWRLVRLTNPIMLPLAGHRWNPIFAVVHHRGRRTGRRFATPVAARRVPGGFVISLSFGAQVDWYRNLAAAGDGAIVWRGSTYRIGAPEHIDADVALASFHPVQRAALRLTGIDGFVLAPDRADRAAPDA
jgi:deazaflavin-dependent oxidoreductase (nitroreductase family)